ncbi:c-type cytochrome biogenesis protein CcmI [Sediminimonas qiaohouensis]|uniref:c-type cytochrome biogenesis protein CcmI n=1 Tax=Sediminimonas qiaohouensis TaxID=552061 RepID=UPI000420B724|nr:c-type cytochrome biogenesis protein CcmI [Sediminimonas qiaohouensis]
MLFWIITGALALAVAAILALALLRGRAGDVPPAAYDLKVYRDQLREIDRDLARGAVAKADAERARAEVSRRILAADAALQQAETGQDQPRTGGRIAIALTAVVLLGGSVGLYQWLGAPGYPDMGLQKRLVAAEDARENRPSQAEVEAEQPARMPPEVAPEFAALMDKLREAVANRPDDARGLQLLVRNEANMGNFTAAYEAQEKLLALRGDAATATEYADYAELLIIAAQGYVSPEAEKALLAALRRDPSNGAARYYMGLMAAQTGRPDRTFSVWRALLEEGPADAPWIAPIRDQIEQVAQRAGVEYTAPAPAPAAGALKGPTAEDMQAAGDMSAEDRQQMIRNMVEGLSDRLATEGGSAAEWARLIGAYGVLGETEKARSIWAEAQQVFAERPEALAQVRNAAGRAGVLD